MIDSVMGRGPNPAGRVFMAERGTKLEQVPSGDSLGAVHTRTGTLLARATELAEHVAAQLGLPVGASKDTPANSPPSVYETACYNMQTAERLAGLMESMLSRIQ